MMTVKKCEGDCGQSLPETTEYFCFRKDSKKFRNICNKCRASRLITYYKINPKKKMFSTAKSRAKIYGLEFKLTLSDIIIPDVCPVLGIPLIKKGGQQTDNSPSIDRIDSSKGYIPSNIKIISWRANTIKNIGNAEEHEAIVKYIRENDLSGKSSIAPTNEK